MSDLEQSNHNANSNWLTEFYTPSWHIVRHSLTPHQERVFNFYQAQGNEHLKKAPQSAENSAISARMGKGTFMRIRDGLETAGWLIIDRSTVPYTVQCADIRNLNLSYGYAPRGVRTDIRDMLADGASITEAINELRKRDAWIEPSTEKKSKTVKRGKADVNDIILPNHINTPAVRDAFEAFLASRRENGKAMSKTALTKTIAKASRYEPEQIVYVINESIENDWQGLFFKNLSDTTAHKTQSKHGRLSDAEIAEMNAKLNGA